MTQRWPRCPLSETRLEEIRGGKRPATQSERIAMTEYQDAISELRRSRFTPEVKAEMSRKMKAYWAKRKNKSA